MTTRTAREFIIQVLQQYPDNECSVQDFWEWQGPEQPHSRNSLHNALARLESEGRLVRNYDDDEKRSYWAIKLPGRESKAPA